MKSVVITGSTRGIGYGLADAFLAQGCKVTVSGRSSSSVEPAIESLSALHNSSSLGGQPCDVTVPEQVAALWDTAAARFGAVDIWINNAGIGQNSVMLWELSDEVTRSIVETNLVGAMYGCRTAVQGMQKQGSGAIYNMEGFGSNGNVRPGLSVYAASKAGVRSLTRSLVAETEGSPFIVGSLSPGMVVTDLLLDPMKANPETAKQVKRFINILGERVETVAPWLVDQVLSNEKHGAQIAWLTRRKIIWRFLSAPFNKRNLFAEEELQAL